MNVIKLAGLLVIALIAVIVFAGIKTAEWACKGNGGKTAEDSRLQKMNLDPAVLRRKTTRRK